MIRFARWLKSHEAQEQSKKSFMGGKKKAFNAKLKAAEKGDANSQTDIGRVYAEGDGVKKDFQEAFKWFTKAPQPQPSSHEGLSTLPGATPTV